MQNLVVINQPNRINTIKRFIQSRGLQRYSVITTATQLMDALLVETANVYMFDFYLDIPMVNTLADMKDSVNTLVVFVPEARIGNTYLNLTDKIHVMPDEVPILMYMWDTPATSLQNVLAARASGTPFCRTFLPNTNVHPDAISLDIRPRQIKAAYSMNSGKVVHDTVKQIQLNVRIKGKPILEDEYDVRKQIGIFDDVSRVVDLPCVDDSSMDYVGQEISSQSESSGFRLPFDFSFITSKPKKEKPVKQPKQPKPKKEKPVKQPKPKKEKPIKTKEKPTQENVDSILDQDTVSTPEVGATMEVTAAPEFTRESVKKVETPVSQEPVSSEVEPVTPVEKKHHKLFGKKSKEPKQGFSQDNEPTGNFDVAGSQVSDVNMTQVFGTISAASKDVADIEVEGADAEELRDASKLAVEENLNKVRDRKNAERIRAQQEAKEKADAERARAEQAEAEAVAKAKEKTEPVIEKPRERISIDFSQSTTESQPSASVAPRKRRLSGLKSSVYSNVEDYMVGNDIITAKQKMEITAELNRRRQSGSSGCRFYDVVLEKGLCEPEDMVQIIAKVNRMEILNWRQIEAMEPIFDEFQADHCKKLKFFRAPDDSQGNVRIVCSLSAPSLDSSIRRLFDNPRILYTLDQYVMEKLNSY